MVIWKVTCAVLVSLLFNAALPQAEEVGLPSFDDCGKTSRTTENSNNGITADILDFPWVAALMKVQNETSHIIHCEAALITKIHILTAAHCFNPPNRNKISEMYVVVGSGTPLELNFKRERRKKTNPHSRGKVLVQVKNQISSLLAWGWDKCHP